MRTTTFKFFTMAMIAMMSFSLTSCSSDDDEDNDGGSVSSINNPLVKEGGLLLSSITCQFGDSGDKDSDIDTYRFFYDEKLRPYKCDNGDDDDAAYFIIDYDNSKMDLPDWSGASNLSMAFNANGYITKIKGSWNYSEDGYRFSGSMEWTAGYDQEGHMTSLSINTEEKDDDYQEKGSSKTTMTWNGGNLVSSKSESKWYDENGSVEESSSSTMTFTYGTQLNKYKQYPASLSGDEFNLIAVGLFGIGPNMLPTSYSEVYTETYNGQTHEDRENYNATFTLNENGSINTESWTSPDGDEPEKFIFSYATANAAKSTAFTASADKAASEYITRSTTTRCLSQTDKAKRVRALMHSLPFVPKRRSGK